MDGVRRRIVERAPADFRLLEPPVVPKQGVIAHRGRRVALSSRRVAVELPPPAMVPVPPPQLIEGLRGVRIPQHDFVEDFQYLAVPMAEGPAHRIDVEVAAHQNRNALSMFAGLHIPAAGFGAEGVIDPAARVLPSPAILLVVILARHALPSLPASFFRQDRFGRPIEGRPIGVLAPPRLFALFAEPAGTRPFAHRLADHPAPAAAIHSVLDGVQPRANVQVEHALLLIGHLVQDSTVPGRSLEAGRGVHAQYVQFRAPAETHPEFPGTHVPA